jgi:hypothetical protein
MNAKPETQSPDHIALGVEVFRRLHPRVSIMAGKVYRNGRVLNDGDLFRLACDVPNELSREASAERDKAKQTALRKAASRFRKPAGWIGLVSAIKAELTGDGV